jgi:methionine aminotransferase
MNYPASLRSKLPRVPTSIFAVMSKMANDYGALNLSQGFPDFSISEELIHLVHKYMKAGVNQYAPMPGIPSLRGAIAEKLKFLYGSSYDIETEITVTAGATQALFTAISALVKEDDEVIVFTPAYDSYVPAIELAGGKPVFVQLEAPDYKVNWDYVKKLINNKTRMILLNSPHNPTGTILEKEDLLALEKLTKHNDIIILSDEVYEHIIFDGYKHQSMARYPDLAMRSMVVGSFGKTFHATGWKMGFCAGPENLMKEFRKVHQFNVFSVNTPIQYAIAEFMQDKQNYTGVSSMYEAKRDLFLNSIKPSKFKPLDCKGTYFVLLDYSAITQEVDTDFAIRLTKEKKIASIPVSVFYNDPLDQKVLRFCFAKSDETLKKAADILNSIG